MIYEQWGFLSHPFTPSSLPASPLGKELLVGRSKELKALVRRIDSAPKMATVEGLNGIGKTSIVNVASFDLYKEHINKGQGRLYIPCRVAFQLGQQPDLDSFRDHVFFEVAQTLIERAQDLKASGNWVETSSVDRWLNAPQTLAFGAQIAGFGGGATTELNTGAGFERSGFRKTVTEWLRRIFPEQADGGVVCVIDNLELLRESERVKEVLEVLRDDLFALPGLRWVLCGALGIIRGAASSPRLNSYLHRPLEIGEIEGGYPTELLSSRINAFAKYPSDYYLPFGDSEFRILYGVLKGNLRDVLSYADNYCQWVVDYELPQSLEQKASLFQQWLDVEGAETSDAFTADLQPRAVEVFKIACGVGTFSPSDYAKFKAESSQALRPHIKALEEIGVLVSTQDEKDKRRKTIQVTPKGWLAARVLEFN